MILEMDLGEEFTEKTLFVDERKRAMFSEVCSASGEVIQEVVIFDRDDPSTWPKVLLTVEQASHLIGISRAKAYAMISAGKLPSVKVGGNRRVVYTDLVTWADGLKREPPSCGASQ